ncbi:MAG: alanine racemase [Actinobacteria bacterium]|nr:MAG: alanine racemase [Actinomycetota bacterium]
MSVERAQACVNVAAIERNCARLRGELRPGVELCAVVKADGYGHGAVASATAALAGGASWLAVATGEEALELRSAGLARTRLLVMGALTPPELRQALAADADVVAWRERDLEALARAGGGRVHVKLDSGMGRLGTRDPGEATRVLAAARAAPGVEPVGAMTHFATADELHDDGFFAAQLQMFAGWAAQARDAQRDLVLHAANSAAVLRDAGAHFDLVRCGIAIYGMDPFGEDPAARALEPALELSSYVAEVKRCAAGESAGYGRRFIAERDTHLAVLPIGYGDGWRRGLSNNADVLIAGRRYPLVGTVSMDNVTVDLGADGRAERLRGEPAMLIGRQGEERITAEEVARRLGTINYEVTCALTPRVSRAYHRDGAPLEAIERAQIESAVGAGSAAPPQGGGEPHTRARQALDAGAG